MNRQINVRIFVIVHIEYSFIQLNALINYQYQFTVHTQCTRNILYETQKKNSFCSEAPFIVVRGNVKIRISK